MATTEPPTDPPSLNTQDDYPALLAEALLPLLTLAHGAENGLFRIVGRDPSPAPGRILLERTFHGNGAVETFTRVLDGDEVLGYAQGALAVAAQHQHIPDTVDPLPVMYDVAGAAAAFTTSRANMRTGAAHLTKDGIISRISHGRLEVVYLRRRERAIFRDEVRALRHGATDHDMSVWQTTRDRFGLTYRTEITDAHIPPATADLALPEGKPHINRVVRGVQTAKAEGWLDYHTLLDPTDTEDAVIHIPNVGGAPFDVPVERALPFILAVADHFGPHAAELISYRPGLV